MTVAREATVYEGSRHDNSHDSWSTQRARVYQERLRQRQEQHQQQARTLFGDRHSPPPRAGRVDTSAPRSRDLEVDKPRRDVPTMPRPQRLVVFERRLNRLQDRFGEALKRLGKPTKDRAIGSARRRPCLNTQLDSHSEDDEDGPGLQGRHVPNRRDQAKLQPAVLVAETIYEVGSATSTDSLVDDLKELECSAASPQVESKQHAPSRGHHTSRPDGPTTRLTMAPCVKEDLEELPSDRGGILGLERSESYGTNVEVRSAPREAMAAEVDLDRDNEKLTEGRDKTLSLRPVDRRATHMEVVLSLPAALRSCGSPEGVVRYVSTELQALLSVDVARLFIIEPSDAKCTVEHGLLWTLEEDALVEAPISTGSVGEAGVSGAVVSTGDACGLGPAMMCVPLRGRGGSVTGVLQCVRASKSSAAEGPVMFEQEEGHVIQLVAQQIAAELDALQRSKSVYRLRERAVGTLLRHFRRRQVEDAFRTWAFEVHDGCATKDRPLSSPRARQGGDDAVWTLLRAVSSCLQAASVEQLLGVISGDVNRAMGCEATALFIMGAEDDDEGIQGMWTNDAGESVVRAVCGGGVVRHGDTGRLRVQASVIMEAASCSSSVTKQRDLGFLPIYDKAGGCGGTGLLGMLVWVGEIPLWRSHGEVIVPILASAVCSTLKQVEGLKAVKEISELKRRHAELEVQFQESEERGKELQAKYARLLNDMSDHERNADMLEAELKELREQQQQMEAQDPYTHFTVERLNAEVASLNDQVLRQQKDITRLEQQLEERSATEKTLSRALDAAERLLTSAPDFEGLLRLLPAAMSLLLPFEKVEHMVRISSSDIPPVVIQSARVNGEVEVSSSSEPRTLAVLTDVMTSGSTAVRRLKVSGASGVATDGQPDSMDTLALSLCVPLVAERSKRVIGSLLLERHSSERTYSEREMLTITKFAPIVSGLLQRAAREHIILQHTRHASISQRAMHLLHEVEKLWAAVDHPEAVDETFESCVAALLGFDRNLDVHVTLFSVDEDHSVLRGTTGEVVPVGVGTLGTAMESRRVQREGHLIYIPVTHEDWGVPAVVRVTVSPSTTGSRPLSATDTPSAEGGVAQDHDSKLGEADLAMLEVLTKVLVPVRQQAAALRSAYQSLDEASAAVSDMRSQMESVRSAASAELQARQQTEHVLAVFSRLHTDVRSSDSLVSLFRHVEAAAKSACGAARAVLLLSADDDAKLGADGAGDGSRSPTRLWTMPKDDDGEGRRKRSIPSDEAAAELHALSHGVTVTIFNKADLTRHPFTMSQSWMGRRYQRLITEEAGDALVQAGGPAALEVGGGGPDVAVIIAPIAAPGSSMTGVIEVLIQNQPAAGHEAEALTVLSKVIGTILARLHAEHTLANCKAEKETVMQTLQDQLAVGVQLQREAQLAGDAAQAACRISAVQDEKTALEVAHQLLKRSLQADSVEISLDEGCMESTWPGGKELLEAVRRGGGGEDRIVYHITASGHALAHVTLAGTEDSEVVRAVFVRTVGALARAMRSLSHRRRSEAAAVTSERLAEDALALVDRLVDELSRTGFLQTPSVPLGLTAFSPQAAPPADIWDFLELTEKLTVHMLEAVTARLYFVGGSTVSSRQDAAVGPISREEQDGTMMLDLWTPAQGQGTQPATWVAERRRLGGAAFWRYMHLWVEVLANDCARTQDGFSTTQVDDFIFDVRRVGTSMHDPVISIPVLLPPAAAQASAHYWRRPVLADLAAILIVSKSDAFTRKQIDDAAQWSGQVGRLLYQLFRARYGRRAELQALREAKLRSIMRRSDRSACRQALRMWRQITYDTLRDRSAEQLRAMEEVRLSHQRCVRILTVCVDIAMSLGASLEEDDADSLLGELSMLAREKLPPAFAARRCTLTLSRPLDMAAVYPVAGHGSTATTQGASAGSLGDTCFVVSKPVYSMYNEVVGVLEVTMDCGVGVHEGLDALVSLVSHFLGVMATLLTELGCVKERHAEALQLVKVLEAEVHIYKEAADKAMDSEAVVTGAGACLLHKYQFVADLLSSLHETRAAGQVVAARLPCMLGASRTALYLPKTAGEPGPEFQEAAPASARACEAVEEVGQEVVHRCTTTRRRVCKELVRGSRLASQLRDGQVQVDDPAFTSEMSILCEPILDPDDGTLRGVLRLDLPLSPAEQAGPSLNACAARNKVLDWVTSVMVTVLEQAGRTESMKNELEAGAWRVARGQAFCDFVHVMRDLCEGVSELQATELGELTAKTLGAERGLVFLCESSTLDAVCVVKNGQKHLVDTAAAAARGGLSGEEIWGLARTALQHYDPAVDVKLGPKEVMLMLPLGQHSALRTVVGVLQLAFNTDRMPSGGLQAVRPYVREVLAQLCSVLQDMHSHKQGNKCLLGVRREPHSRSSVEAGNTGFALISDILPALLEAPLRINQIEDLFVALSSLMERFVALNRGAEARQEPSSSVAVDLFALDREGLWTVDKNRGRDKVILTVPPERSGIMWSVATDGRRRIEEDVESSPLFSAHADLVGFTPPTSPTKISLVCLPVLTLAGPAQTKLRGVLRLIKHVPLQPEPTSRLRGEQRKWVPTQTPPLAITSTEEAVMEALAKVLGGSIQILDSAVQSKALSEIYDRTEKALSAAQQNLMRSRAQQQQLQEVRARASVAAVPLCYEPPPLQSSSEVLAGRAMYGHVARVARAATAGCSVLVEGARGCLYLTKDGGARCSSRLDAYDLKDGKLRRRDVPQPIGHGLLGRCLRKAIVINVGEPRAEKKYHPKVDGDGAEPLLLMPLKTRGKAVSGVLKVTRAAMPFTADDSLNLEVFGSHVAVALSYATALDEGTALCARPSSQSDAGLHAIQAPAVRRENVKAHDADKLQSFTVKEPSFLRDESSMEDNIEELKRQLRDIQRSTRGMLAPDGGSEAAEIERTEQLLMSGSNSDGNGRFLGSSSLLEVKRAQHSLSSAGPGTGTGDLNDKICRMKAENKMLSCALRGFLDDSAHLKGDTSLTLEHLPGNPL